MTLIHLYELVARERGLRVDDLPLAERRELGRRALPVLWPGFELANESERDLEPIELVPYDPAWPTVFAGRRERLLAALGDAAVRIDHVGSTAVPGLAAKPTVDVQVSVARLEDESLYSPQLGALGLQLRGRDSQHRYFRPFSGQPRTVHVHLCAAGGEWEREHLLFRDYLRSDPGARERYSALKDESARRWSDDRLAYTEAKTEGILGLLAEAEEWAAATRWPPPPEDAPRPS